MTLSDTEKLYLFFSQSVRRTSIRDKSLISRREAREEARMRQEQQEQSGTDEVS